MTTSTQTWRLALCKRYLFRAEERLSSGDVFAAAEAVVAAQDGMELLLGVVADEQSISVGGDDGFMKSVNKIFAKTAALGPFLKPLDQLNHLRVGVKHNGTLPDEREARRLVGLSLHVARQLCISVLLTNFDAVRIADGLAHRIVGASLAKAEGILETWDGSAQTEFEDLLAEALEFLRMHSRALLDVRKGGWDLERRVRGRGESWSTDLVRLASMVDEALEAFRDEFALLHAGVARTHLRLWEQHLPSVDIALSGDVRIVRSGTHGNALQVDTARDLFLSILTFAERMDQLERTSRPETPLMTVRAVRDATAVFGSVKPRDVASIRAGAIYQRLGVAPDDSAQQLVRMFGLDVRVPSNALESASSTP